MKTVQQIAVLNTGFLGLLESGMEVDCRVTDVTLEDIQAAVFYFGGEITLDRLDITEEGFRIMTVLIERNKSKITLVHTFKNKVAYACQKEAFGSLTIWAAGSEFTIIDDLYLVG